MYEAYYGLNAKPFQLNPDPSFYFASKQHRRAKAYLEYGVLRNEGFIVITGEIGAGKTTIVRGLLESLDEDKVVAGNLVSTQLDAEDTLRMVGAAFGVRTKDVSKADLLMSLEGFLVSQTSQGKRCLLVVDEAQNLTPRAVEELRMLSNFQFGKQALLQSFLVGQPEFREILQNPQMQQLRQRVIAACHIGPMDADETQGYIEHRLKCAGGEPGRPNFEELAYQAIFEASGGIPRRINSICDRLLLLGFLENKTCLAVSDVKEVALEIHQEAGRSVYSTSQNLNQSGMNRRDSPASDIYVDPSDIDLDENLLESTDETLVALENEQKGGRLERLEQGMLRLERSNMTLLSTLRTLVAALHKPNAEKQI